MRRALLVTAAALAFAGPGLAQSPDQPSLTFTISAGLTTGSPLWDLPRQLVTAPGGLYDTLTLARRLRPGVTAVLSAALYRSPHLAYTLEAGYFGTATEGRCGAVGGYRSDIENKNQQACNAIQGTHFPTSVTGFQGGVLYRWQPRGPVSPYVRASAGVGVMGTSFVQTSATVLAPAFCALQGSTICTLGILEEPRRKSFTWVSTLAAGMSIALGESYRLRLEARDLVISLPVATDTTRPSSSNPIPVARVEQRTRHIPTLTAGVDVILERRNRRRY